MTRRILVYRLMNRFNGKIADFPEKKRNFRSSFATFAHVINIMV
jgi:hypothetical protein